MLVEFIKLLISYFLAEFVEIANIWKNKRKIMRKTETTLKIKVEFSYPTTVLFF